MCDTVCWSAPSLPSQPGDVHPWVQDPGTPRLLKGPCVLLGSPGPSADATAPFLPLAALCPLGSGLSLLQNHSLSLLVPTSLQQSPARDKNWGFLVAIARIWLPGKKGIRRAGSSLSWGKIQRIVWAVQLGCGPDVLHSWSPGQAQPGAVPQGG